MRQLLPQIIKMYQNWDTEPEGKYGYKNLIKGMFKLYDKYGGVRVELDEWDSLGNGWYTGITIADEDMIDTMSQILKQAIPATGGTIEWTEEENIKGRVNIQKIRELLATKGIKIIVRK